MMLTAREARDIATKLGITPTKGRGHDKVVVVVEGKVVGRYGIQRGSGDHNHNYIANQLGVGLRDAHAFARCPLNVDGLIDKLKERGRL